MLTGRKGLLLISLVLGLSTGLAAISALPGDYWTLRAAFAVTSLICCVLLLLEVASADKKLSKLDTLIRTIQGSQPPVSTLPSNSAFANQTANQTDRLDCLHASLSSVSEMFKATRERELAMIEKAVDVICVIDTDCKFLSVSPASKTAWGYSEAQLVGASLTDFLLTDCVPSTRDAAIGAEASIDKIVFENRFRKSSGEVIDLLWSGHWSASSRGLFCVAHDITERKVAEELLRQSEERIRDVLQQLPAGVLAVTRKGNIDFANDTAVKMLGLAEGAIAGKVLTDFVNDICNPLTEWLQQMSAPGHASLETFIVTASNGLVPVDLGVRKIVMNKTEKFLITFTDATQRQEIERLKRDFVAMIGHDIRTPLCSLRMVFEMLGGDHLGALSDRGHSLVDDSAKAIERLIGLTTDLLDLEQMSSGKFLMSPSMMSSAALVEDAANAVRAYCQSRRLQVELPDTDCEFVADHRRLVQVLTNLLSNAAKYSPDQGKIQLTVIETADHLRFAVRDEGPGVPESKQQLIFQRYSQGDLPTTGGDRNGAGLGLAIAKLIVEQHKGRIGVISQGAGSEFWFEVPRKSSMSNHASGETS